MELRHSCRSVVVAFFLSSGAGFAGGGYSIVLGDTATQSEAENLQNFLTSIGYNEIAIVPKSDGSFLVTGGMYKYKLDAIVDSNALKKRGFSGGIYSGTTEPLNQSRPIIYP